MSNRKTAIVARGPAPPHTPPPVDFTVNRASPLVTGGQCAPFAFFSPPPGPSSQTLFWIRPSDSCPLFLRLLFFSPSAWTGWGKCLCCWAGARRPGSVIFYTVPTATTIKYSHPTYMQEDEDHVYFTYENKTKKKRYVTLLSFQIV